MASTAPLGQLGVVTADSAPIRSGRGRHTELLSVCSKGIRLAVNGQDQFYYRVVMLDGSFGYIERKDVHLLPREAVAEKQDASDDPGLGRRIAGTALKYLGESFSPGIGASASDFVRLVFSKYALRLPSRPSAQAAIGYAVPTEKPKTWRPGDRLYFALRGYEIDNAALYVGDGMFISDTAPGHRVRMQRLTSFYAKHLVAVRRSSELLI